VRLRGAVAVLIVVLVLGVADRATAAPTVVSAAPSPRPGPHGASTERVTVPPNAGSSTRVAKAEGIAPFDLIGLRSKNPGGRYRLHVRGAWTAWTEFSATEEDGPDGTEAAASDKRVSEPEWADHADGYQVELPAGSDAADVLLVRADAQSDTAAASVDAQNAAASSVVTGGATDIPGAPFVFPRSSWTSRPPATPPIVMSGVKVAFVHHTVNANNYSFAQVPGMLAAIQAYHMDGNGWNDIAYNFLVDRFGYIWEGRGEMSRSILSAATGGFNTNTVSIAVLGDYSSVAPSQAVVDAIARIAGWELGRSGIDPQGVSILTSAGFDSSPFPAGQQVYFNAIEPHRSADWTGCPGHIADYLPQIRAQAVLWALSASHPFGALDSVRRFPDHLSVRGWAIDPNVTDSLTVTVYVDGNGVAIGSAASPRPDVGAAFGAYAAAPHGFDIPLGLPPPGPHTVCVYGLNVGYGLNAPVGCAAFTVATNPYGALDTVAQSPGAVHVAGWAIDPDTSGSIVTHVYVDGVPIIPTVANRSRPDVDAAYPAYGAAHGFDASVPTNAASRHQICVYGINVGSGTNALVGCAVYTPATNPFGALDTATQSPGSVHVTGWAIDPDTSGSIVTHVYVDGVPIIPTAANLSRPDVGAALPGYGAAHGFDASVPTNAASHHQICVYGINVGPGTNALVGCRTT